MAGPTAVGKSAVALRLAQLINAEIISVDSMQVYRGMDIGTAKPTAAERAQVPHHLIDVITLRQSFDASEFVKRAVVCQTEIIARGRVPLFCGGTGLYFRAFLEGLGSAPAADLALRAELAKASLSVLLEELAHIDPELYQRIDRSNKRRVVRALEVIRLTGKPFSEQRAAWRRTDINEASDWPKPVFFGLRRPPLDLNDRISARVDTMFAAGLVNEVASLALNGLQENLTAREALGYKQVLEFLQGQYSLDETIALVKSKTRQYAKRQMTWFRRQIAGVTWVDIEEAEPSCSIAERIARLLEKPL